MTTEEELNSRIAALIRALHRTKRCVGITTHSGDRAAAAAILAVLRSPIDPDHVEGPFHD